MARPLRVWAGQGRAWNAGLDENQQGFRHTNTLGFFHHRSLYAFISPVARTDRLRGYTLRVGLLPPTDPNHFTQSAICFTTLDAQGPLVQNYPCNPSIAGRYVSLRIDGRAECLNFAELEVYGLSE